MNNWPKTDKDLASFLGCSADLIRAYRNKNANLLREGIHYEVEYHKSNARPKYLWSFDGAVFIAKKTKKDKAKRFLEKSGVIKREESRIESQVRNIIISSLDGFISQFKVEYAVGPYRVDLYLPELKLAIECDENNHSSYCKYSEEEREEYIKEKLGCDFLRFDPCDYNFNVGKIINHIFKKINLVSANLPQSVAFLLAGCQTER